MKKHVTFLVLLSIAFLGFSIASAYANTVLFNISLTGSQETPPNVSRASGIGTATFDTIADTISLNVTFTDLLAAATASHIHDGAPGVSGGVIVSFVPFTPPTTSGTITGGPLSFPLPYVSDLLAGDTYFNIHDAVFPAGEIRGQLEPVSEPIPEPATILLMGSGLLGLAGYGRKKLFKK